MSSPVAIPSGTAGPDPVEVPAVERASEDKYDAMLRLADVFDAAGEQMRRRARLGQQVLGDDDVAASEPLSPRTFATVADEVREATTGRRGLLARSVELDADALVVRATVQTYRWIDELQDAAYKTLGSIAGRAIGYLAPGVALGGVIVSAGLIETDALDRDGVAAYLTELAANNPDLMDHVTSGGGGLLDGLQMRSLLTAGVLAGESAPLAAAAGLRSVGVVPFEPEAVAAIRDVAGGFVTATSSDATGTVDRTDAPRNIEELMVALTSAADSVSVQRVGSGRYIAYLPGPGGTNGARLRLVGGDTSAYTQRVVAAIEAAVAGEPEARVMLVGSAQGGVTAVEVAAAAPTGFAVDQVVTAGAPAAQVPRIPDGTRVLSLEDRADPVALLGSLINARTTNRLTVVFEGDTAHDGSVYVAGGRAADAATHPELRAEIERIRGLGYLAG